MQQQLPTLQENPVVVTTKTPLTQEKKAQIIESFGFDKESTLDHDLGLTLEQNEIVFNIGSIPDLKDGYNVYSWRPISEIYNLETESVVVAIFGDFNVGKSYLQAKLLGIKPLLSDIIRTPGICVAKLQYEKPVNDSMKPDLLPSKTIATSKSKEEQEAAKINAINELMNGNPPLNRKEAQKKYNEMLKEKKDNPVIESKIETKEAVSNNFERVKLVICDGAGTSRPGNYNEREELRATEVLLRTTTLNISDRKIMVSSKFDAETQDKLQGLIKTLNKIERRQNSFAGRVLTQKIIYVHNYKDMSAYKSLMLTVSEVGVCYDIPLNKTREACLDYDWKPRNQIIQDSLDLHLRYETRQTMHFFLIKDKPLTEEEKKENPPGWDPVAYNDMVIKDLRDQLCNTKQRTKNIFKEIQQSLSKELEDILFNEKKDPNDDNVMEWDETTHLFLPDDALAVDPEEEPQYMAKMVPAYLNVKSFSKAHEKLYKRIGEFEDREVPDEDTQPADYIKYLEEKKEIRAIIEENSNALLPKEKELLFKMCDCQVINAGMAMQPESKVENEPFWFFDPVNKFAYVCMMNCNFVPELLNTNDYKINYEMRKGAIQIQVVSPKPKIPVGCSVTRDVMKRLKKRCKHVGYIKFPDFMNLSPPPDEGWFSPDISVAKEGGLWIKFSYTDEPNARLPPSYTAEQITKTPKK